MEKFQEMIYIIYGGLRCQQSLLKVLIVFIFFSREETIHISSSEGEMKVWLEPEIEVAKNINFSQNQVTKILNTIKDRQEEINDFWNKHFSK